MNAHGSRHPGRRAAEQLLDGTVDPALARLLDAAAAPARPAELAGEDAAVAAFRAAAFRPDTPGRRRPVTLVKVAAAAVAVLATGGVGVAAATGHIGGPSVRPATHHAVVGTTTAVVHRTTGTAPVSTRDSHGTATSPPSLADLCRTFAEHPAPADPAFAPLVTAAGGQPRVSAYCGTLLGQPATTQPAQTVQPTQPVQPTHAADPTHPAHPTHPTHPTHPATPRPSHPPHPSH